jgi:branched-chain amino acid aminotransferase
VLRLAPDLGYEISEERLDLNQVLADLRSGKITEAFGMGTAAVIAPVGKFGTDDEEFIVNGDVAGPVATHLFKALTDIQYGRVADPYGWTYTIKTR